MISPAAYEKLNSVYLTREMWSYFSLINANIRKAYLTWPKNFMLNKSSAREALKH